MSIEDVSTCRRPHNIFHNKAAISKIRIKKSIPKGYRVCLKLKRLFEIYTKYYLSSISRNRGESKICIKDISKEQKKN